jgi:hypothetical protein
MEKEKTLAVVLFILVLIGLWCLVKPIPPTPANTVITTTLKNSKIVSGAFLRPVNGKGIYVYQDDGDVWWWYFFPLGPDSTPMSYPIPAKLPGNGVWEKEEEPSPESIMDTEDEIVEMGNSIPMVPDEDSATTPIPEETIPESISPSAPESSSPSDSGDSDGGGDGGGGDD